jgi:hypothetical protein
MALFSQVPELPIIAEIVEMKGWNFIRFCYLFQEKSHTFWEGDIFDAGLSG